MLYGLVHDDSFKVINDIIYYKERIFLVPNSNLENKIIEASHDSPLVGLLGYIKTYRRVR